MHISHFRKWNPEDRKKNSGSHEQCHDFFLQGLSTPVFRECFDTVKTIVRVMIKYLPVCSKMNGNQFISYVLINLCIKFLIGGHWT